MVGLLDIAPTFEEVDVGAGQKIPVYGVSVDGIAYLLQKFPEVVTILTGGAGDVSALLDYDNLMKKVPGAIVAIIACGCGYPGNEDAEQRIRVMPALVQAELFEKVISLTMPTGVGPFVERLEKLANVVDADTGKGRSSKSPPRSKS